MHCIGKIWIITLVILAAHVFGGELSFVRVKQGDGVFRGSVTCQLQDHQGFMWFGTLNGLYRFDGYRFNIYKRHAKQPGSLPHNLIYALHQDEDGFLWIGTHQGLARFNPRDEKFLTFAYLENDPASLPHEKLTALLDEDENHLWVATRNGLGLLDKRTERFTQFGLNDGKDGLSQPWVWDLARDNRGRLLVATRSGLFIYNNETSRFSEVAPLAGVAIFSLFSDSEGGTWLGTENDGLKYLSFQEGTPIVKDIVAPDAPPKGVFLTDITQDQQGSLWVASDGAGLFRFKNDRFEVMRHDRTDPYSPISDRNLCLTTDRHGLLWVGTFQGLNHTNLASENFQHFEELNAAGRAPDNPNVWSILKDSRERLWVGTWQGLNLIDQGNLTVFEQTDQPNGLRSDEILDIYEDDRLQIWLGTQAGLHHYQEDGTFTTLSHYVADPGELAEDGIYSIEQDSQHNFWIAAGTGTYLFQPDTGRLTHYPHDPNNANSPISDSLTLFHKDRKGRLWLGAEQGLHRVIEDEADKPPRFIRYRHQPGQPNSLGDNYIISLADTSLGQLLIGTSDGLDIANVEGEKLEVRAHFGEPEGLPDNMVFGVLEDTRGNLWLSLGKGIVRIDPRTGQVRAYSRRDGLASNEYNQFAYHRDASGKLYFGGDGGLDVFDPAALLEAPWQAPLVVLTGFTQAYNERSQAGIGLLQGIDVPLKDNYLNLTFAALDFHDPGANRYSFIMEGNDPDWIDGGHRGSATYTNLAPGSYQFRVKATNAEGVWSETTADLQITIVPPFYRTTWFKATALLILLTAFVLKVRARFQRDKEQKEQLRRLVAERTRQLNQEKERLERIDEIARAINSEVHFNRLLRTVLEKTRVIPADEAQVLIYNRDSNVYQYMAAEPETALDLDITYSVAEAARLVLADLDECKPRVYTGEQQAGRNVLVLCLEVRDQVEGYVIYSRSISFEPEHIELLQGLEAHIVAAMIKTRLLRQLNTLNERKNEFMSIAAHDLRAPLGSIFSYAEVLEAELATIPGVPDETRDDLILMKDATGRIMHLLNELLDIAAIESGKMTLDLVEQDLSNLMRETTRLFRNQAKTKKIELNVIEESLPPVLIDRARMMEVLENLVGNALKFTLPGGRITLRGEKLSEQVVIHVEDTGQGISRAEMKHLFTRYKKLGAKATGGESRSGLGLAITRKIIELHRGQIWVQAEPDKGSVFSFSLPLSDYQEKSLGGREA